MTNLSDLLKKDPLEAFNVSQGLPQDFVTQVSDQTQQQGGYYPSSGGGWVSSQAARQANNLAIAAANQRQAQLNQDTGAITSNLKGSLNSLLGMPSPDQQVNVDPYIQALQGSGVDPYQARQIVSDAIRNNQIDTAKAPDALAVQGFARQAQQNIVHPGTKLVNPQFGAAGGYLPHGQTVPGQTGTYAEQAQVNAEGFQNNRGYLPAPIQATLNGPQAAKDYQTKLGSTLTPFNANQITDFQNHLYTPEGPGGPKADPNLALKTLGLRNPWDISNNSGSYPTDNANRLRALVQSGHDIGPIVAARLVDLGGAPELSQSRQEAAQNTKLLNEQVAAKNISPQQRDELVKQMQDDLQARVNAWMSQYAGKFTQRLMDDSSRNINDVRKDIIAKQGEPTGVAQVPAPSPDVANYIRANSLRIQQNDTQAARNQQIQDEAGQKHQGFLGQLGGLVTGAGTLLGNITGGNIESLINKSHAADLQRQADDWTAQAQAARARGDMDKAKMLQHHADVLQAGAGSSGQSAIESHTGLGQTGAAGALLLASVLGAKQAGGFLAGKLENATLQSTAARAASIAQEAKAAPLNVAGQAARGVGKASLGVIPGGGVLGGLGAYAQGQPIGPGAVRGALEAAPLSLLGLGGIHGPSEIPKTNDINLLSLGDRAQPSINTRIGPLNTGVNKVLDVLNTRVGGAKPVEPPTTQAQGLYAPHGILESLSPTPEPSGPTIPLPERTATPGQPALSAGRFPNELNQLTYRKQTGDLPVPFSQKGAAFGSRTGSNVPASLQRVNLSPADPFQGTVRIGGRRGYVGPAEGASLKPGAETTPLPSPQHPLATPLLRQLMGSAESASRDIRQARAEQAQAREGYPTFTNPKDLVANLTTRLAPVKDAALPFNPATNPFITNNKGEENLNVRGLMRPPSVRAANENRTVLQTNMTEAAKRVQEQADSVLGKNNTKNSELFRQAIRDPRNVETYAAKAGVDVEKFQQLLETDRHLKDFGYYLDQRTGGTTQYAKNYHQEVYEQRPKGWEGLKQGPGETVVRLGPDEPIYSHNRKFADQEEAAKYGFERKQQNYQKDIQDWQRQVGNYAGGRILVEGLRHATRNAETPQVADVVKHEQVLGSGRKMLQGPGLDNIRVSGDVAKELKPLTEPASSNLALRAADRTATALKKTLFFGSPAHAGIETGRYAFRSLARGNLPRLDQALKVFGSAKSYASYAKSAQNEGLVSRAAQSNVRLSASPETGSGSLLNTRTRNPAYFIHDATFNRLINYYKLETFRQLENSGKIDTSTAQGALEARQLGNQINALYGGLNHASINRSQLTQQGLRIGLLAPDFNEGKIRTLAALLQKGPAGSFARQTVVAHTVGVALATEIANRITTGKFDTSLKDIVQNDIINPHIKLGGTKHIGYPGGTYPSDIHRLLSNPRQFLQGRGSGLVGLGTEFATGKDYFGRPAGFKNLGHTLEAALPLPVQAAEKAVRGKQTAAESALQAVGFHTGGFSENNADKKIAATRTEFSNANNLLNSTLHGKVNPVSPDDKSIELLAGFGKLNADGTIKFSNDRDELFAKIDAKYGKDSPEARATKTAYDMLGTLNQGISGSTLKAQDLDKQINNIFGPNSTRIAAADERNKLANQFVDETVPGQGQVSPEDLHAFTSLGSDEDRINALNRAMYGKVNPTEADKANANPVDVAYGNQLYAAWQAYLGNAGNDQRPGGNRTNLNTAIEQVQAQDTVNQSDIARNYPDETRDLTAAGKDDALKALARNPSLAGVIPQAIDYTQRRADAGVITQKAAASKIKELNSLLSGGTTGGGKVGGGRRSKIRFGKGRRGRGSFTAHLAGLRAPAQRRSRSRIPGIALP